MIANTPISGLLMMHLTGLIEIW